MRVVGVQFEDDIEIHLASSTMTATANGVQRDGYKNLDGIILIAVVSAASGTAPTLDIKLQDSIDSGATWQDTGIAFAQMAVAGTFAVRSVLPLAPLVRPVYTIGGTTPSFTFSLRAYGKAKKSIPSS